MWPSTSFFIAIIKAIVCGDVLNALGYRIRPYEVEAGATNRALEIVKKNVYEALVNNNSIQGFWGGAFGNASSCPSCTLNPLSNSAYLVGD